MIRGSCTIFGARVHKGATEELDYVERQKKLARSADYDRARHTAVSGQKYFAVLGHFSRRMEKLNLASWNNKQDLETCAYKRLKSNMPC